MIASPIVGVAACLREGFAAYDEARSFDQLLLDSHDEPVIGAAQVADGGEAAHQHIAHDLGRAEGNKSIRQLGVGPKIGGGSDDVNVAINQAGHQALAGEVNYAG